MQNYKQKLVSDTLDKNIFLVAPAGTGKTDTLAIRISNILKSKKAKEENLLCITFTNKATKEMRDRIEKILLDNKNDNFNTSKITIKTFHSFCLEIIKTFVKKTDLPYGFTVFDEEDAKECVKKVSIASYHANFNKSKMDIKALFSFINLVKEHRLKKHIFYNTNIVDYKTCIKDLYENKISEINKILKDKHLREYLKAYGYTYVISYNQCLLSSKAIDFNDIITYAKLLFNDDEVVKYYRDKFTYISIDEVQDTSITEYEIIEKLFKNDKEKNVLLAGDIFQTIYKWRGSQPKEIFDKFIKECNPLEISFDENYRSTKTLTGAGISFLENQFNNEFSTLYNEGIKAHSSTQGNKINIKSYENVESEAIGIYNEFKNMIDKGNKEDDYCVLTRFNKHAIDISDILKRSTFNKEFEFVLVDQFKFFRRAEIKDIIAIFKILINPYDAISMERVLRNLDTGIGKETLNTFKASVKTSRIQLVDLVSKQSSMGEFYSALISAFEVDNSEIVVFDVESTGTDVTTDEIIQIAAITINKKCEIIDKFERFIKPNKSVGLSERVHGFTDEKLNEIGENKEEVLNDFLDYIDGKIIVGHNVQYDINILTSELSRFNMRKPNYKYFYDTLDIYRRFHPFKVSNHKLETLSKEFKTKHKPSHDAFDDIVATGELLVRAIEEDIKKSMYERLEVTSILYKKFEIFREKYFELLELSYTKRPFEMIFEIQNRFNLLGRFSEIEKEEKMKRIYELHQILSIFDDISKSSRDSLISIVDMTGLSSGEIENLISKKTDKIRIPIITVHQAKGLEFDNVIIAGCSEGAFPSKMYGADEEEEAKIFYVAMTRAKKNLILTYPNVREGSNGYKSKNEKSCFIDSIDNEFLQ